MSHTTTIGSVVVTDIKALKKTVTQLNKMGIKCELLTNATPRMYYRSQEVDLANLDYVLKLHGSKYDVGFTKNEDGSYSPVTDLYNNQVANQIGAACPMPDSEEGRAQHAVGKLMQKYAENAVVNAAKKKGQRVRSVKTDKNGNIQIRLYA